LFVIILALIEAFIKIASSSGRINSLLNPLSESVKNKFLMFYMIGISKKNI